MRRTGAEAIAAALGLPLDVVTDRAEAGLRLGRVPRERLVVLRARRPTAYVVAIAVAIGAVTLGIVLPGLHPGPWAPWVLLLAAAATVARRVVLLRAVRRVGWAESLWVGSAAAGRDAPALGVVDDELVVSDGTGWEARMPGPRLGGVGAVVVARDVAGQPWAVLLVDRDEQVVLTLPAAEWGIDGDDAAARLGTALAAAGLVVTGAQIDPPVAARIDAASPSTTTAITPPTPRDHPADHPADHPPTTRGLVGWPPAPVTPPWRVPPEPFGIVLLLVAVVVLTVALGVARHWGGCAVSLSALVGLVMATPFARIMAR